jgi:hypothetical protein
MRGGFVIVRLGVAGRPAAGLEARLHGRHDARRYDNAAIVPQFKVGWGENARVFGGKAGMILLRLPW